MKAFVQFIKTLFFKTTLAMSILFLLSVSSSRGQIAQRGSATFATSASASVTVSKPTGVVAGDIMIANIGNYFNGTNTSASSSGWTVIAGTNIDRGRATLLYKIAGGSEPSNYTFSVTTSSSAATGAIVAFSGVDNVNPFDVTAPTSWTTISNQTISTLPAITTATPNAAILVFGASGRITSTTSDNFTSWTLTNPSPLSELFDAGHDGVNNSVAVGGAWGIRTSAGSTGNGGFTCTPNTNPRTMGGIMLALKNACNTTAGAASSTPTLCINTALTNITHTTTGATGIGTATGLPTGVTAAWTSNTITISGTPTASGTFNYSIPLTGGCASVNATGTITINSTPEITTQPSSAARSATVGTNATQLTVAASGTSLSYQWYSNSTSSNTGGTSISGATSTSYTPSSIVIGSAYYYAIVTNACGTANSNVSGLYTYIDNNLRYAVAGSNNWSNSLTWSYTSGGTGGAQIPDASDDVYIDGGDSVVVDVNNAVANSINFTTTATTNAVLYTAANSKLVVSGNVVLPRASSNVNSLHIAEGILEIGGSFQFTSSGTNVRHRLLIGNGVLQIAGDLSSNSTTSTSPTINFYGNGTIKLAGSFTNSSVFTFTKGTGTFEYNGAGNQSIASVTGGYYNLTLSGGGVKTFVAASNMLDLKIESGTRVQLLANTEHSARSLMLGGIGQSAGTYGGFSSTATGARKNVTYFGTTSSTSTNGLLTTTAAALPVTLYSFTAKATPDNKVSLAWVTTTEQVNKGFRIERQAGSTNGKYEQIGFVGSKAKDGNSQSMLTYNFIDAAPKVGAASFYRLVQEDLDGKLTYTEVRVVKLNGQSVSMVFPNPSNGAVNISRTADGKKMNIQVIDQSGKIISQVNNITDANYRLNISQSGIYSIKMMYPETGEQSIQRVVVQK